MSDPNDLWQGLWMRLSAGVEDVNASARNLALATERMDGGGAARFVVLRGIDRAEPSLTFYTHIGSDKAFELADEPKAEVLLWDAASSFQARLSVSVEITPGSPKLWDRLSKGARLNYVPTPPPGSAIEAPFTAGPSGPEAFAVLTARIQSADILDLSEVPHKRAQFKASENFTGRWVAP